MKLPENWEEELEIHQYRKFTIERYSSVYNSDAYIFPNGITIVNKGPDEGFLIEIKKDDDTENQLEIEINLLLAGLKFNKHTKRNLIRFKQIKCESKGYFHHLIWNLLSINNDELSQSHEVRKKQLMEYSWRKMKIEQFQKLSNHNFGPISYKLPNEIQVNVISQSITVPKESVRGATPFLKGFKFSRMGKDGPVKFRLPSQYHTNIEFYNLLWSLYQVDREYTD